ncbi:oxidoreductase [Vibrio navarrensis]|uniref:Sulfurtransferase TusA family protein n=1 Tax=Vibrio navarrensis TaxID=29495 RepID=A0AAJ4I9U3_9VIBR|nr:sulfurtransferase TusA family protein [Vibrio navarrensis]MBE3668254.1 oxidoreductase [Vibrio navarrensis]MBE4593817.1 oxidoreductase [Vibrio navarrensis]QPL52828.1 sulfurtransferase TusA family protein [Vibrio navarrensis]
MEPTQLDLRAHRCPMALLLAKRHSAELVKGSQSVILISDQSSLQDIVRYLQAQHFEIETQVKPDFYLLRIFKKDVSSDV